MVETVVWRWRAGAGRVDLGTDRPDIAPCPTIAGAGHRGIEPARLDPIRGDPVGEPVEHVGGEFLVVHATRPTPRPGPRRPTWHQVDPAHRSRRRGSGPVRGRGDARR